MDSQSDCTEQEIVAACRRGERWAQRELFVRHHRALFRVLMAQCGNPDDAEDLVQETFLRAYGAIGSFRGDSRVRTWLTRIALNALYASKRKEQRQRARLDELGRARDDAEAVVARRSAGAGAASDAAAADSARSARLRDLLLRALGEIGESDRLVIALHDVQGFSYDEIAEMLEIAPGTVGSRLSRARRRLRRVIVEMIGDDVEENGLLGRLISGGREPSSRVARRTSTGRT